MSPEQKERYGCNIGPRGFGESGKERPLPSNIFIVGAGGLGSPLILYLAAASVGKLTIIDPQAVEASNLQRQIIRTTADIGHPKAISAKEKASALNPEVRVNALVEPLREDNIRQLVTAHDFTVEWTDCPVIKFLTNDIGVEQEKPFINIEHDV